MELSATGLSSQVRGSLLKEKRSEHSHGADQGHECWSSMVGGRWTGLQVQLLRFPPRVAASPLLQRMISVSVMVPQSWPVLALCIGPR
jgi:hypothetical protein